MRFNVSKATLEKVDRYYLAHQDYIDSTLREAIGKDKDYRGAFTYNVLAYRQYKKVTTDEAIKGVMRSETYQSDSERLRKNALAGLRSDKKAYAQWRALTRHQKIDKDKIVYEGNNTYSYIQGNKQIFINYDNSPVQILVWSQSLV